MAGGRRGGAGERVLEGRHVIGLFCLMLVFSGVFFTLGYVMGKNQDDGQVRAAPNSHLTANDIIAPRIDPAPKRSLNQKNSPGTSDTAPTPYPEWEFYHAGEPRKSEGHLKPAGPEPAPASKTLSAAGRSGPKGTSRNARASSNTAHVARGAYYLQVAALRNESDALALAENLQKKQIPAFVTNPSGDKFYRVQVGPYADPKSAEAAKKGLKTAGFRAIVKH